MKYYIKHEIFDKSDNENKSKIMDNILENGLLSRNRKEGKFWQNNQYDYIYFSYYKEKEWGRRDCVICEIDGNSPIFDHGDNHNKNKPFHNRTSMSIKDYAKAIKIGNPFKEIGEIHIASSIDPKDIVAYKKLEKSIPSENNDIEEKYKNELIEKLDINLNFATFFDDRNNSTIYYNYEKKQYEIRVAFDKEKALDPDNKKKIEEFFNNINSFKDIEKLPDDHLKKLKETASKFINNDETLPIDPERDDR
jgi:hypothetical protein